MYVIILFKSFVPSLIFCTCHDLASYYFDLFLSLDSETQITVIFYSENLVW